MLPIVAELDRPTRARKCAVIFGAMGAVCSLLLVVGVTGYITFGDQVESNVLFSYPHESMFVVRIIAAIVAIWFTICCRHHYRCAQLVPAANHYVHDKHSNREFTPSGRAGR